MAKTAPKKVVFISSFPPRKCGIAAFTSNLIDSITLAAKDEFEPLVVAMRSEDDKYNDPVKFEIRQNVKSDYIYAADYINFSHVDLVSVQHEFGLFGGQAGAYLSLLIDRLKAPGITTLHTILDNPDSSQYKTLVDTCKASYKVITMSERGVGMLQDVYNIPAGKIKLIAHGVPDLPFIDSNYYKQKVGLEDRRTILTSGLLNENKGIEVILKAMPAIIKAEPSVIYIILGMTHPNVLKRDGESYRFGLQQMVKDLNLQEHVIFHNRFVADEELHNFLCAADVYVTPYLNEKQLTSGTLSFAVGAGKAIISTPYWAATELLADGRGKLVQFGDSQQMSREIVEILRSDTLYYSLRRQTYEYGRSRTWPKIGQIYWKLFSSKIKLPRTSAKTILSASETISSIEVPEPSLNHLEKMTDDTGLYQHAKFTIPNRECGYCTDDNARAVIALTRYYDQYPEPRAIRLLDTYLSFIIHSQNDDGSVKNFMDFNRSWHIDEPAHDALGRVLWAFGTVIAKPPAEPYLSIATDCFDKSVKLVQRLLPKGMAYSILGMSDHLKQFPGAIDIKRQLELAADGLVRQYEENNYPDWQWFEEALTYDNAVLPHAMYAAGMALDNKRYREVADATCEFLLENIYTGTHFSFIGCNGWYERGQKKATFDQQPIEAGGTVMMLGAAYEATQNKRFLTLQRKAFDWFLGQNDIHVPLYDFRTKGCNDGLGPDGVNTDQGAESTLSLLLSLLTMVESYAGVRKNKTTMADTSPQEGNQAKKVAKKTPNKKHLRKD
jgi:glycosyltransferase involved in cell wall biosynthesis